MCIICLKPAGIDLPSDEEIKHMFSRNPHGAGFALQGDIYGDGRFLVEYHKGFMNVDDLIEALGPREKLKDLTVAIHCRIKTSGETDKFTTHPFPISNQYSDLRELDGNGAVLFHNGIFSGLGGIIDPKASDTQDFVVGVASRYLKNYKMPGKIAQAVIAKIVGDCRVLILYPKKTFPMLKIGTWHEHNGCWYSNTGYLDTSVKTLGYGSYYSEDYESTVHQLDEWGCNIAKYAWPSNREDWIRFDDKRWETLRNRIEIKRVSAGETFVQFACTNETWWIWDEDNKQIYTEDRRDDVMMRQDEEDQYYLYEENRWYKEDNYIWFEDESAMLDWLEKCEKISDYVYKFENKKWYIDVSTCEAYTDIGIVKYFEDDEMKDVKEQLSQNGEYILHNHSSKVSMPVEQEITDEEIKEYRKW